MARYRPRSPLTGAGFCAAVVERPGEVVSAASY